MSDRLSPDDIRQAHAARCIELVEARGHKLAKVAQHERVGPCPRCGGTDRFGVNVRKNVWNCRQCTASGDAIALVQHLDGVSFREAVEIIIGRRSTGSFLRPGERSRRRDLEAANDAYRHNSSAAPFAAQLWAEAKDPRSTLAEKYLDLRGISLDEDLCGRVLRFHPACPFGTGNHHPCLIAAFRPFRGDPDETLPPQAIHRVAINRDGSKIDRKMLGGVGGAAIKLNAAWEVETRLGICEGLETGLSIYQNNWHPIWVLGSAGAIERFPVLPGIERLTVFADHDLSGAGLNAAIKCKRTWRAAGVEVRIFMPRAEGQDWNDVDRGDA